MAQQPGDTRALSDYDAHLIRLHKIVLAWQAGEISVSAKRDRIAAENDAYYHGPQRGNSGEDLTVSPRVIDHTAFALSDLACVPMEAAQAALGASRQAAWDAEHADDLEAARGILARGRQAYEDILRAAR